MIEADCKRVELAKRPEIMWGAPINRHWKRKIITHEPFFPWFFPFQQPEPRPFSGLKLTSRTPFGVSVPIRFSGFTGTTV